jgi:hypothetical protein
MLSLEIQLRFFFYRVEILSLLLHSSCYLLLTTQPTVLYCYYNYIVKSSLSPQLGLVTPFSRHFKTTEKDLKKKEPKKHSPETAQLHYHFTVGPVSRTRLAYLVMFR